MNRTPPLEMPDFGAIADHGQELVNGVRLLKNLSAFNDPHITTKLNKLDDFTNNVNGIQQTIEQNINRSLTEAITKAVEQTITRRNQALRKEIKDHFTKEINTVKNDLTNEIHTFRDDLTNEIHTFRHDLTKQISTSKDDLTGQINSLEQRLSTSIAAQ
ncbi:hypothetical protein GGS24DRAFT_483836 [Hypoxylon argillaceum]|nr:hypothetical protein GGS24DRAFT_483836 [Hypoxylon argillaceum]